MNSRIKCVVAAIGVSCTLCLTAAGQQNGGNYELLPRGNADTLRELRHELEAAINRDAVDEAAVRQAAHNRAAAEEEFYVFKSNVPAKIRAALTTEHRAELDLLSTEELEGMGFGPPHHGSERPPQPPVIS